MAWSAVNDVHHCIILQSIARDAWLIRLFGEGSVAGRLATYAIRALSKGCVDMTFVLGKEKVRIFALIVVAALFAFVGTKAAVAVAAKNIYSFSQPSIDGKVTPLSNFKGKVILVVNVASKCGYTKQYPALEALYKKYQSQGFVILGFPANNFGGQEPGSNAEIKTFCSTKYNVTFPMYSKISVLGTDQAPLYQYLTTYPNPKIAGPIVWNFTKFLIDRNGTVIQRFESAVTPDSPELTAAVEKALKHK